MRFSGAELLVRLLERQGVRLVAGIPGGAILPLYDALARSTDIRHVLARHEQGAGFLAAGFARASGAAGVCVASSGPGATNLITAVADAKRDSVPLIVITGQVPRSLMGTDAFQEIDTAPLAENLTKAYFAVRNASDLYQVVPNAFRTALSGRPGPVWIDVPKDVQTETVFLHDYPDPGMRISIKSADAEAIERAVYLMRHARRPVLYLGGGIVWAGACLEAMQLAERMQAPCVMTLMALGVLPMDHVLSLGMVGMHAAPATQRILDEADLLVALGVRFDDRATGRLTDFCPDAQVIHVDIDQSELGKLRRAEVPILGDVGQVLKIFLARLAPTVRSSWMARVCDLRQTVTRQEPLVKKTDIIAPQTLLRHIAVGASDQAIVVTDVGQHQMWVAQYYPLQARRRWLTSGGLGAMGFGLPTAIGAALAEPNRMILCFTGDGGILMNVQELATLAELALNVKIVLMDNGGLGLVYQQQNLFYKKQIFASQYKTRTDFIGLARAFGIEAMSVTSNGMSADAWRTILMAPGPCLIHVPIEAHWEVMPMVPPGASNRETIETSAGA